MDQRQRNKFSMWVLFVLAGPVYKNASASSKLVWNSCCFRALGFVDLFYFVAYVFTYRSIGMCGGSWAAGHVDRQVGR